MTVISVASVSYVHVLFGPVKSSQSVILVAIAQSLPLVLNLWTPTYITLNRLKTHISIMMMEPAHLQMGTDVP